MNDAKGKRMRRNINLYAGAAMVLASLGVTASSVLPAFAASATPATPAPVAARAYLAGENPSGLRALAQSISTPGSRDYRKFVTSAQFIAEFGPTAEQTSAVENWLREQGVTVTGSTEHYVAFDGSAAQVAALESMESLPAGVLGVLTNTEGQSTQANTTSASTEPTRTAGADGNRVRSPGLRTASHAAADGTVQACSHYYGEVVVKGLPESYGRTSFPAVGCGYVPSQLRTAYGVTQSGLTGRGVTIGIVGIGTDPDLEAAVNHFATDTGDAPFAVGQFEQLLPTGPNATCTDVGWAAERAEDVEVAHGLAPGADVVYSASPCVPDDADVNSDLVSLLDGLDRLVDSQAADVISTSWATDDSTVSPAMVAAWNQTFEEAAVEGIGLNFASGDSGDYSLGGSARAETEFPADDPWVTSVGGTTLEVDKSGSYRFETGWGASEVDASGDGAQWTAPLPGVFDNGGGGGTSTLFSQPWYQQAVVPRSLSGAGGAASPMRVVPDVAADADFFTGLWIGEPLPNGSTAGGTSLASPLFAAIQADAQQALGGRLGFANPLLYSHYGSTMFHDVTDNPLGSTPVALAFADIDRQGNAAPGSASLITEGRDTSLHATRGYDDVTGLGSPACGYLAAFLQHDAVP
jgi:subtilase family serine protease